MEGVFLKIVEMSADASWLILTICVLRLVLKRMPGWSSCLLWGLAALRLVLPFSPKSAVSLIPKAVLPAAENIRYVIPQAEATIAEPTVTAGAANVIKTAASPLAAAGAVWLMGMAALLGYAAVSFLRVKHSTRVSAPLEGNIRLCDHIASPFILGIFRPIICIPSGMEEAKRPPVIAHEKAHIARGDHLWKPLGYAILALHWFNPLCWLAYILLCRDIEMACDEKVIRDLTMTEKKSYSAALLECSVRPRFVSACPLAFGEVGVKQRIGNVLRYRKPAPWVAAISMALCVVLACCFLTDPIQAEESENAEAQPIEFSAAFAAKENSSVREAPSLMSRCMGTLPEGETITVYQVRISEDREWSYGICTSRGLAGWIVTELLSPVPDAQPEAAAIAACAAAEVRSAPTEKAKVIGTIEQGTVITVQKAENVGQTLWLYAQYETTEEKIAAGWIPAEQISAADAVPAEAEDGPGLAEIMSTAGEADWTNTGGIEIAEVTPIRIPESRTAVTNADVREFPSQMSRCMGTLPEGETITVYQQVTTADAGEWSYGICYTRGIAGWILTELLNP